MMDVKRQRVSSLEESSMVDSKRQRAETIQKAVQFLMEMSESMVQFFGE